MLTSNHETTSQDRQAPEPQEVRQRLAQGEPEGDAQAQVEPWFPSVADAQEVHDQAQAEHGQVNNGLLRPDALEGALGRAQNHWAYEQSLLKAAAALAHGVGQAQAFEDGNKRTAYHLTRAFLDANGYRHVSPWDFDDEELADHLIGYGEGTHGLDDTARMFEERDHNGRQAAKQWDWDLWLWQ